MNLPALPDLRAAETPSGPAVADDYADLNNSQFLAAVQRAAPFPSLPKTLPAKV